MKPHSKIFSKLTVLVILCSFIIGFQACGQKAADLEKVALLNKKLTDLAAKTDNQLFSKHLNSIQKVINEQNSFSKKEAELLKKMYDAFLNDSLANPSDFNSYLNRERTMILAWTSPSDSTVSFSWLRLPKDWDAEKTYPLYVQLHGRWDVAARPISYMSYTFVEKPSTTTAFEDGYFLSPWGRGNKWYHGISKTDIWESITELEKMIKIDPARKYLCGHSMGGYGTWHIAQESDSIWAAIGIHSGALYYNKSKYLIKEYADKLKNTPTYFVWGNNENQTLIESNEKALELLKVSGNQNIKVAKFNGGHDYNEIDVEKMYNWMRKFKIE